MSEANIEPHMAAFLQQQKILAEQFPHWYAAFEDIDPFIADRADVESLLKQAPNEFASGILCGIIMFRQQLAVMTGREF